MSSETQYYQAKVFLKAYKQALQTLDDVHRNNANLAKNISYKNLVVNGYQSGQISIKNGEVKKDKNFDQSRIKRLCAFNTKLFTKDFTKFESISSISQLTKLFEQKLE